MLIELTISSNIKKLLSGLSPENIRSAMRAGMVNVIETAEAYAVPETPVISSALVNSETSYMKDDFTGILKATARHAKWVHDGTGIYGPHKQKIVIIPKNKKALYWPGAKHPVRKVEQKGIRPNPFFTRARKKFSPTKVFNEGIKNFLLRRLK